MNHTLGIIELDLHGKTVCQANVTIENALRRKGGAYTIRLIHGHNMGTAIKTAVMERYNGDIRVLNIRQGKNPGITELVLREL